MADEKISFLLDLDVKDFTEKGLQAKGIIQKLGSEENLSGLLEGLLKVGPYLATAGAAAYAFKKAIDLTVEGEEINRINKQFEILATQAGIAPKELQEGLEKAGGGLVDTTDMLKIANESLVKMGASASELPKIMEIARKSVSVYGGDAKSNFQAISEAIANGNVRALKHYGITIDMAKAEREFAEANGVTAGELSEVGKKQAILNAALEAGNEKYKNLNENTQSATLILQRLKVTFTDIGETIILYLEKKIGPAIRYLLSSFESLSNSFKLHLTAAIGEGAEQARAKAILAGKAVDDLSKKQDASAKKQMENSKKLSQEALVDQEKHKKQQLLFNKEMQKLNDDLFTYEQLNISKLTDLDRLNKTKLKQLETQHQLAIQAIRANTDLTTQQKAKLLEKEDAKHHQILQANEKKTADFRKKMLDQYVKNSQSANEGIARSFIANTEKSKAEQEDFGKQGDEMYGALTSSSKQAFTAMGADIAAGKDVAQSAEKAILGTVLSSTGDIAIARGGVMFGASVWPPQPPGLAGGLALMALGGALKAAAGALGGGGSGASVPSPSSSASSGGQSSVKMESGIQKDILQSKIALADKADDQTETLRLKKELLEVERKEAQQALLDKENLSDQEKSMLVIKNDELFNLKKQELERENLLEDQSKEASRREENTAMPGMEQQQKSQRTVAVNIAGNYLETDQTKRMLMDLMRQESDATGFNYNQIGA